MADAWTHPHAYLWFVAGSLLILAAVPTDWSFSYLNDERNARGFLEVLWQVTAAAVALSVAVVVVALEVFSSRSSGSLREDVQETGLLPIAYVGLTAILLNGVVLVELIREPRGGPATWAAINSGLAIALLPVLFARSSSTIDQSTILRARAEKATREARRAVAQALFDRLAYLALVELCNEARIRLETFLAPTAPPTWTTVRSQSSGTISDVNIYQLARLARAGHELKSSGANIDIVVGVRVGSRVGVGSSLISLAPGFGGHSIKVAGEVFRVESS